MAFTSHMAGALDEARRGEVPVGAVLVGADGRVLAAKDERASACHRCSSCRPT